MNNTSWKADAATLESDKRLSKMSLKEQIEAHERKLIDRPNLPIKLRFHQLLDLAAVSAARRGHV